MRKYRKRCESSHDLLIEGNNKKIMRRVSPASGRTGCKVHRKECREVTDVKYEKEQKLYSLIPSHSFFRSFFLRTFFLREDSLAFNFSRLLLVILSPGFLALLFLCPPASDEELPSLRVVLFLSFNDSPPKNTCCSTGKRRRRNRSRDWVSWLLVLHFILDFFR